MEKETNNPIWCISQLEDLISIYKTKLIDNENKSIPTLQEVVEDIEEILYK